MSFQVWEFLCVCERVLVCRLRRADGVSPLSTLLEHQGEGGRAMERYGEKLSGTERRVQ